MHSDSQCTKSEKLFLTKETNTRFFCILHLAFLNTTLKLKLIFFSSLFFFRLLQIHGENLGEKMVILGFYVDKMSVILRS